MQPSNALYISITNTGMIQVYSTVSVSLWWFMLAAALFWKIWFPLHARSFQLTRKIKYLHFGCALLGIFIPVIPVISFMIRFAVQVKSSDELSFQAGGLGFASVRFPPLPCNGNDKALIFYSVIFPTDILLAAGITLTVLIFWIVHKVSYILSTSMI